MDGTCSAGLKLFAAMDEFLKTPSEIATDSNLAVVLGLAATDINGLLGTAINEGGVPLFKKAEESLKEKSKLSDQPEPKSRSRRKTKSKSKTKKSSDDESGSGSGSSDKGRF